MQNLLRILDRVRANFRAVIRSFHEVLKYRDGMVS